MPAGFRWWLRKRRVLGKVRCGYWRTRVFPHSHFRLSSFHTYATFILAETNHILHCMMNCEKWMNKYHDVKKISRVFTCFYHPVFYYSFEAPLQTSLVSGDDKVQRGIRKLQTYNDLALHVFFKRRGSWQSRQLLVGFASRADSDFHWAYTTLVRNNNDPTGDNRRYLHHVFRSVRSTNKTRDHRDCSALPGKRGWTLHPR